MPTTRNCRTKSKGYESEIETLKTDALNTAKTYALKEQLSKAGVTDADYLIYKQGGIDKFTFDKDGKPVGVDDILKPLREDKTYSHLFCRKRRSIHTKKRRWRFRRKSLGKGNI